MLFERNKIIMICNIKSCSYSICNVCNNMNDFDCEYKDYIAIGSVRECSIAVNKMDPKAVLMTKKDSMISYNCPNCNNIVGNNLIGIVPKYCDECGQRLLRV